MKYNCCDRGTSGFLRTPALGCGGISECSLAHAMGKKKDEGIALALVGKKMTG